MAEKFDPNHWQKTYTTDVTYCCGDDCHQEDPICMDCEDYIGEDIYCGSNGHLCPECYKKRLDSDEK